MKTCNNAATETNSVRCRFFFNIYIKQRDLFFASIITSIRLSLDTDAKKMLYAFPSAKGDIFRSLVLADLQSKTPKLFSLQL